jgi:hypothetical protein
VGEESRLKRYERLLYRWLLFGGGGLLLGKLVQDGESFLNLCSQTLGRIEQAQELGIIHLQQHTSDLSSEVGLGTERRCKELIGWMSTSRHLRGNAHVENFTKHLFLFHWRDIRKGGGVEGGDVRGVTNGWSRSRGATIAQLGLGSFSILRSVVWRRSALRLARLRAGLRPSTRVGLTGAAVLRGTGGTTVAGMIRLRRRVGGTRRHHVRHGVGRVTGPGHAWTWLTISNHATSTRGRVIATSRRVKHRTVDVATGDTGSSGLLHADLVALGNLALQLLPSNLTALSERDIEGLGTNHLVVHICYSLGGLLRNGEANETEALGVILIVTHDFGAGDGSERLKLCAELFVVNVVVEILDIEVDPLILAQLLHLGMFVRPPELFLTFDLLLSPGHEKFPAIVFSVVEFLDRFGSIEMILEVDESKTSALPLGIDLKDGGGDGPEVGEQLPQSFLTDIRVQVLDVDVGELFLLFVN